MQAPSVFVSLVTYNNADTIVPCLEALLRLEEYVPQENLFVEVIDNASEDETCSLVEKYSDRVTIYRNGTNLGFSAAHNQAAHRYLETNADFFLVLNPDVALVPNALHELVLNIEKLERVGTVTPLLLRSDDELKLLEPAQVDSAGIVMTSALRHFDRGAGDEAIERYQSEELVFGGTGACLLLTRSFVEAVSFRGSHHEEDLFDVYPELEGGMSERTQLFDEAFFAYREDADLAWRAQRLGWRCLFVPSAVGFHQRVVTPERRASLPAFINRLGVRNRFLLQLNNLSLRHCPSVWLPGVVFRNFLVVLAVLLRERSSLQGLREAWRLRRRARERFQVVNQREASDERAAAQWFGELQSAR